MPMTDKQWLILDLEAPLLAFGGVVIDQIGVTRDFPAASMLTGLFANALGWKRTETEKHQALQDRLVFAARIDRELPGGTLTDMQNAQLEKNDRGWTSWGIVEGRDGASYGAPHRRKRDYHMDARMVIAVRLEPLNGEPDLERLAKALHFPARPLFIGRKPCLPSRPILPARREHWFVDAPTAYAALTRLPAADRQSPKSRLRAFWPPGEGPEEGEDVTRIYDLPDLRNWKSGLHGGHRRVIEGFVMPEEVAP
ncbi:type I-E CRISPR-associated protein Cas5/CasD [Rhizobium sp. FKY42]|uniref:type I-E CRISPR-associated protein Cas5/CasD n=1 Tax=Rhizobium sp. FKY42 TaxID=2562310 RepID=UPI00197EBFE8|nr:type I-E CRISPR-associated protein Cas5/CasD [Rhizobium sp. FKY42]